MTKGKGYKRELARIKATQHSWIKNKYGVNAIRNNEPREPLKFKSWLLQGMNYHFEEFGIEFEVLAPGLMRIKTPGQRNRLRTLADFEREYYNEYIPLFN